MKLRVAGLLLAAGTTACLFEQPLIPGSPLAVDRPLIGAWRCVSPDGPDSALLTISTTPEGWYSAEFKDEGDEKGKPTVWSAYSVTFEKARFLNVRSIGERDGKEWTIARYTLFKPTVLNLEQVKDKAFDGATTREARLALLKKPEDVFQEYCTCVRIVK
jgi:hypothetical protein